MNRYYIQQAVIFHKSGHFRVTNQEFLNQEAFGIIDNISVYKLRLKEYYQRCHLGEITKILLNYEQRDI